MKKPSTLLLVAAAKMGWGDWDKPCYLSPDEYAVLKKARLLDRKKCAAWIGRAWNASVKS
jgi:hypothetical protein